MRFDAICLMISFNPNPGLRQQHIERTKCPGCGIQHQAHRRTCPFLEMHCIHFGTIAGSSGGLRVLVDSGMDSGLNMARPAGLVLFFCAGTKYGLWSFCVAFGFGCSLFGPERSTSGCLLNVRDQDAVAGWIQAQRIHFFCRVRGVAN